MFYLLIYSAFVCSPFCFFCSVCFPFFSVCFQSVLICSFCSFLCSFLLSIMFTLLLFSTLFFLFPVLFSPSLFIHLFSDLRYCFLSKSAILSFLFSYFSILAASPLCSITIQPVLFLLFFIFLEPST